MRPWVLLLSLAGLAAVSDSARILGFFPYYGRSHFIMFEALMKGLAKRGHDVTVVSHFPQKTPVPHYTDLSMVGAGPVLTNNISAEQAMNWSDNAAVLDFIWSVAGVGLCDMAFSHPVVQELSKPAALGKYDLFVSELWGSDCFVGLAHRLGIPHIAMVTTMEIPWSLPRYGSPLNPAYQTNHFTMLSYKKMDFCERLYNTIYTFALNIQYHFKSEVPSDAVMRKFLGNDLPPLSELIYNSSLLFTNGHLSMHAARPLAPNVIEVGGLHIPEPQPLPADLQKYLDDAKDGVVVFALGSMIKSESFDKSKVQSFVEAFRKLPQKVLWKYDGVIENQPKNLMVRKWLPQSDVLRHPNVRLFITHGGLMGTQEAFMNGVPLVGIPFFGDQRTNIKNYMEMGIAEELKIDEVATDVVYSKMKKVLDNPSYSKNAKEYAKIFNDRPMSAMDTALYWTEYVIRHKGAHHLRPAATQLLWYQYYLLDVLGTIFLAAFIVLLLLYKMTKKTLCIVFGTSQQKIKKH